MKELKEQGEKWFNCGCQDWRYIPAKDFTEKTDGAISIHNCIKIKVYQCKKSIARCFVKNIVK